MGILDDAIREHLELKRSHGAPEDEVRRKEAEAFGAARQDAPAPEPALDEHTQLLSPEAETAAPAPELEPLEPAPEDPYAVHPTEHAVPDPDAPHAHEPAAEPATEPHDLTPAAEAGAGMLEPHQVEAGPPMAPVHHHHHDEQHPALVDHDHIGGEEHPPEPVFGHGGEPATEPPDVPPEPDEAPSGQSHEPVEDEDEDVLEETPEFLQDAPEHDRLWFEQRPPRDFDFGE